MDAYETTLYTSVAISLSALIILVVINVILLMGFNRRFFKRKGKKLVTEIKVLKSERTRIAHDLHDGVISSLAAIGMELEQTGAPEFAQRVRDINKRLTGIIENVLPPDLEQEDFEMYMGEYFKTCSRYYGCPIEFQYKVKSTLPAAMKMQLYLMLEEIVYNTMKHAKASKIVISVKEQKQQLQIATEDNGIGFELNGTRRRGIGLTSLFDRALILGGKLYCYTAPGKGTIYNINIPIQRWDAYL